MSNQYFGFDELATMMKGVKPIRGKFMVACPLCGPGCRRTYNRRRKVLAIWLGRNDGFLTFQCQRCDAKGWAKDEANDVGRHRELVRSAVVLPEKDLSKIARWLWEVKSKPLIGSLADTYLRKRQCFVDSPNIRFVPASGKYQASMIARFSSKDGSTNGVHLTRLSADGKKANVEIPKIMIGPSAGWPIIVSLFSTMTLFIAEGIEDAASLAIANNASAWAAGSAGRIASVVLHTKSFAEVFIAVDDDAAGHNALADAKKIRPDVVGIDFTSMMHDNQKVDANKILVAHGAEVLRNYCKRGAAELHSDMKEAV